MNLQISQIKWWTFTMITIIIQKQKQISYRNKDEKQRWETKMRNKTTNSNNGMLLEPVNFWSDKRVTCPLIFVWLYHL
jgi:hypothetical protein